MRYKRIDGKKVSLRWYVVLRAARRAGVRFRLNSGHRTMREQRRLYRENMNPSTGRPYPGKPLTAKPNPNAPHIRTGRHAHALDVDVYFGHGEAGLETWLRRRGVRPTNPVRGEAWHLELDGRQLRVLARRLKRAARR